MYLTQNGGKFVIAESFIKYIYIDKLDDIKNKCSHIDHIAIKMKPADVKSSTYTDSCYTRHVTS